MRLLLVRNASVRSHGQQPGDDHWRTSHERPPHRLAQVERSQAHSATGRAVRALMFLGAHDFVDADDVFGRRRYEAIAAPDPVVDDVVIFPGVGQVVPRRIVLHTFTYPYPRRVALALLAGLHAIQRQVELQHVDAGLAKDPQEAPGNVRVNDVAQRLLRHATLLGDPWNLIVRRGDRDVRIQPRARRCD